MASSPRERKLDGRLMWCQTCGHWQRVKKALQLCEICSGRIFAVAHPRDRIPGWMYPWKLTQSDVDFLRSIKWACEMDGEPTPSRAVGDDERGSQ